MALTPPMAASATETASMVGPPSAAVSATTPTAAAVVSRLLHWGGPKQCLLVKEGVHIILDRILIKDNTHLIVKCPLYGRLSRVEKRAAVLRLATALLQRTQLVRNVLVDTLCVCIAEACESEGRLEALTAASALDKKGKPRVPFMQRVIGEALEEALAGSLSPEDKDVVNILIKQKATAAVVTDSMARLRAAWLSPTVAAFFAGLSEAGVVKQPPIIYSHDVERALGIDYFLPPPPSFAMEDERMLADAIKRDEEEAGKETVFAANLKKALKLLKQNRMKASPTAVVGTASSGSATAAAAAASAGGSSSSAAAGSADAETIAQASAVDAAIAALGALSAAAAAVTPPSVPADTSTAASSSSVFPRPCDTAIPRADDASMSDARTSRGWRHDWWSDLRWVGAHCHVSPTAILRELHDRPAAWLTSWNATAEWSDNARREVLSLTADETCDVIDHQPLWLSLRGMVGTNLFADGMWPVTSNDGQLAVVKFRRNDRNRFWYIEPSAADPATLTAVFLAWARTMTASMRPELRVATDAASGDATSDELARAVQKHLESAILSFMLMKAVSACIQKEAARAAEALGSLLLLEEELLAAAEKSNKAGKKKRAAAAAAAATSKVKEGSKPKEVAVVDSEEAAPPGVRTPPRSVEPASVPAPTTSPLVVAPRSVAAPVRRDAPNAGAATATAVATQADEDGEWEEVTHRKVAAAVGSGAPPTPITTQLSRRERRDAAAAAASLRAAPPVVNGRAMAPPVLPVPAKWPAASPMKASGTVVTAALAGGSSVADASAVRGAAPAASRRPEWADVVRPPGAAAAPSVKPGGPFIAAALPAAPVLAIPAPLMHKPALAPAPRSVAPSVATLAYSPLKVDSASAAREAAAADHSSLQAQLVVAMLDAASPSDLAPLRAPSSSSDTSGSAPSVSVAAAESALAGVAAGSPLLNGILSSLDMSPPRTAVTGAATTSAHSIPLAGRSLAAPHVGGEMADFTASMSWVTSSVLPLEDNSTLPGFPLGLSLTSTSDAPSRATGPPLVPPSEAVSIARMASAPGLLSQPSREDMEPLFRSPSVAASSGTPAHVQDATFAAPPPAAATRGASAPAHGIVLKASVKNAPPGLLPAPVVTAVDSGATSVGDAASGDARLSPASSSGGSSVDAAAAGVWGGSAPMGRVAAGAEGMQEAMMMWLMLQNMQVQASAAQMGGFPYPGSHPAPPPAGMYMPPLPPSTAPYGLMPGMGMPPGMFPGASQQQPQYGGMMPTPDMLAASMFMPQGMMPSYAAGMHAASAPSPMGVSRGEPPLPPQAAPAPPPTYVPTDTASWPTFR